MVMLDILNQLAVAGLKIDSNSVNVIGADPNKTMDGLLTTVFFLSGAIAVVIIVVASFFFVTSAGNQETVKKAKNAILGAVVGLVVISTAFAIVQFVIGAMR